MSEVEPVPRDVPMFSECVTGFRTWVAGPDDQLWPLSEIGGRAGRQVVAAAARDEPGVTGGRREPVVVFRNPKPRPWLPGINTARCNCAGWSTLRFECSWDGGRRVVEPAPEHEAPDGDCQCGLYSWRRPPSAWQQDPRLASGECVAGAVASWGRLQVHGDGFRSEHACVVTLAFPESARRGVADALERIASRYRVELVAFEELERGASAHGTPLPDTLRPLPEPTPPKPPAARAPEPIDWPFLVSGHAPDATVEEVGSAKPTHRV